MAIEIIATGRAVPSRRITNDDLAARLDTSDEWIRSHTGIGARHIVDEGAATSDLCLEAARAAMNLAIEQGAVKEQTVEELARTLDLIVIGTSTPDYHAVPTTACIVQHKLGAEKAGAFDLAAACTGFIYSLECAAGLLSVNPVRKRALVIGADSLSRITDWENRDTCILFGDGAGAALMEKTAGSGRRGLLRTVLCADGSGGESLIVRRGGSRAPYRKGELVEQPAYLEMDGRAVYTFAVKAMTDTVERLLAEEGISAGDLAWIVPHQANARIVQAAGKRLGIPEEKFFLNIDEYANTSAGSIPIALDELNRSGQIKRGDLVMTIGFGGGLTFGGNLILW